MDRPHTFHDAFNRIANPKNAFGFCMTAAPRECDLKLGIIAAKGELFTVVRKPSVIVRYTKAPVNAELRGVPHLMRDKWPKWRTIRGVTRAEQTAPARLAPQQPPYCLAYEEIHSNGLIEMAYVSVTELPRRTKVSWDHKVVPPVLWDDMPLLMLAEIASWAVKLRAQAGMPNAEYVVNVRFRVAAHRGPMLGRQKAELTSRHSGERPGAPLPTGGARGQDFALPNYAITEGGPEDVKHLLSRFDQDLWRWVGQDISESLRDYSVVVEDE